MSQQKLLQEAAKHCYLMKPLSELRQVCCLENYCFSPAFLYLPGFTKVSVRACK